MIIGTSTDNIYSVQSLHTLSEHKEGRLLATRIVHKGKTHAQGYSPHIGSLTIECRESMELTAVNEVINFHVGRKIKNEILI